MIIYDPQQLARTTHERRATKFLLASPVFCLGIKTAALLLAFSYFDAVVSGGISEVLRINSWTPLDQMVSDMYQLGFGISVLVIMGMLIARKSKAAILCAPLLAFYCEDTMYYLLQPLASPVIKMLIGMTTPEIRMPQEVSGWIGWVMRVVFNDSYTMLPVQVYLLNVIGVAIAGFGLIEYRRRMRNA